MTGGIIAVRNIPYDGYQGPRLPKDVQLRRVQRVVQEELTQLQREQYKR